MGSFGDLIDTNNMWEKAYGVPPEGAVLVRPDGYVAWRLKEEIEKKRGNFKSRVSPYFIPWKLKWWGFRFHFIYKQHL